MGPCGHSPDRSAPQVGKEGAIARRRDQSSAIARRARYSARSYPARRTTAGRFPRPQHGEPPSRIFAPLVLARRCRVGLLGGSFNPAHRGHLALSRAARILLGLDEIWWLVSPANPLKDPAGIAPLETRIAHARHLARKDPAIRVLAIEAALDTRYTAEFLDHLFAMRRGGHFLWLAGLDIIQGWRRWRRPTDVAERIPLAVFARPPYFWPGLHGWFATRYRDRQVMATARRSLIETSPPAWTFLRHHLPRESATALRRRLGSRWWEAIEAPDEEAF